MSTAKTVNQKRKHVAREAQNPARTIGRKYQKATTSGLNAASRSVGEFNNGFQEIADDMTAYSIRSLENVFHAWQPFLDARPLGQVNNGFQEIADEMDEMNAYSVRSLENAFRAWQQFLDAGPLRQVVEHQMRWAQNACEAYVTEFSRLGDLYLSLTLRASEPLRQISRRSL